MTVDFVEDWERSARPLLIIDEVRPDGEPGEQFVFYAAVVTDTARAVNWAREGLEVREQLLPDDRERTFKGKHVFPRTAKTPHERMGQFVHRCLSASDGVAFLATTNAAVSDDFAANAGGIRDQSEGGPQEGVLRRGRELLPILAFLKWVALNRRFGSQQVDVLIDRSRQLGLDVRSTGIQQDQFQVRGPTTFNTKADGTLSEVQCPSSFRIISMAEDGKLRDLLLLPDAVAYAGAFHGHAFDRAKARLVEGERFGSWFVEFEALGGQQAP